MRKILNQTLYNLNKEKSSFVSFGIIILITALILSCAAVLLLQVDKAYDKKLIKLDTASVNAVVPEFQSSKDLKSDLKQIKSVEKVESHKAILAEATVKEFNGADFAMNTMFYNMDAERSLNRFELLSESEKSVKNPIYIPLYASDFGGFSVGEEIVYVINGKSHVFTVAGVIEEMQYGNYGSALFCAYLPQEEFEKFSDTYSDKSVTEYSMALADNADIKKVKEDISKELESKGVMLLSNLDSKSVKSTRTMTCDLVILILTAFSIIILAVSVFLSNFRVKNSIESEIVNMSVLKALGYTGNEIIAGITLPYVLVSVFFAGLGVGASYLVLPVLSSVLGMQSGFTFDVQFDALSLVAVVLILTAVVTFFTFISAGKIKKTQPIDGLRGNMGSKSSKKNHLPLAETKGNIKFLLVLKQMISTKKQNIMLFLVTFVLTVLIAFSGTLFFNVAIKPENFMSALSDETPDVIVTPQSDKVNELEKEIKADNRVENSLQYMSGNVKIKDTAGAVLASEDFSKVRNDVCYKGANPAKDDEIALGRVFDGEYKIGDTVKVSLNETEKSFKVTGFVQSVNLKGEFCELSLEGYESLSETEQTPVLYVYLKNPADAEKFAKEYKNSDYAEDTVNSKKLADEASKMYMDITVVLVAVIFVVTILIVLFIMYIVIKSLLQIRRQELGVYKAMGYTSSQLILQTAGSFMPVIILSTLISTLTATLYMPAVYNAIFEALGVMKNNIEISLVFLLIFAAAEILVNIIISIILCMPVRKISAYSLIKE